jgi:hypothetical protein
VKHGIRYQTPGVAGLDALPEDFHCHGYPVKHLPECNYVAVAMMFHVKHIVVGNAWFLLSGGEQWAVLLHEVGHLEKNHFWKRLLWLPLCWTKRAERMAQLQELEADHYVITKGYGLELLRFFRRALHLPQGDFHPNMALRYLYVEEKLKNAAAA